MRKSVLPRCTARLPDHKIVKKPIPERSTRLRALRYETLESREMLSVYFVDATAGNDSWDGAAGAYVSGTNGPWKTIDKVNSMTQQPGDTVLFKRGEVWRETLIPDSGSAAGRITYGVYGDENLPKPQLLASVEMNDTSDWYNVGGNIWSTTPVAPTVIGSELISNTSFTYNTSGWQFGAYGDAVATGYRDTAVYDSSPAGYSVNCTENGSDRTYIQLYTINGISITADSYYLLTFRAKSTLPSTRAMEPVLYQISSPWANYGTICSTCTTLTTEWTTYSVLYKANTTATDAGIRFFLGNEVVQDGATFSIDSLSFKQCTLPPELFDADVGNIIFNNGESCGVKKWGQGELSQQGNFYHDTGNYSVKVYSTSNPANLYSDIEIESQNTRSIDGLTKSYVTYENFDLRYSDYAIWIGGREIYGGVGHDVTVRGCDVSFIGGGQWIGTVRGGNGIEVAGSAYNILIENNRVWDVYDAGISMEGTDWGTEQGEQHDIIVRNNLVWNCEYNYFIGSNETSVSDIYFENNTGAYGGYGWSEGQRGDGENGNDNGHNLDLLARNSVWTDVYIRNNIFYESLTAGFISAIYNYNPVNGFSTDYASLANIHLDYNLYYESSGDVVWMDNGNYRYTSAQFAQYQAAWSVYGYDAHSIVALPKFLQLPASPYTIVPSDNDFKIMPSSPAVDSGTNTGVPADFIGTTRPRGSGYDIGAYESIVSALLPGDANLDGTVNQIDSAIVSSNWLMPSGAGWGDGDFNGDQRVDDRDATIMAANFGRTITPETSASSAVEPKVSYDLDNSGKVDLGDLAFFASVYGEKPGITTENPYAYAADFDRSGRVDLGDLALFAAKYQLDRSNSSFAQAAKVRVSSSAASETDLTVGAVPAILPGNANHGGTIDATNAGSVANIRKSERRAVWIEEDCNGNRLLNDDYTILARHWMMTADDTDDESRAREFVFSAADWLCQE